MIPLIFVIIEVALFSTIVENLFDFKRFNGSPEGFLVFPAGEAAKGLYFSRSAMKDRLTHLWDAILERVATLVNAQSFQTWFKPTRLVSYEGATS